MRPPESYTKKKIWESSTKYDNWGFADITVDPDRIFKANSSSVIKSKSHMLFKEKYDFGFGPLGG